MPPSAQPQVGGRLDHLLGAEEGASVGRDLAPRSLVFDALVMVIFVALGLLLLRVFSPLASLEDVVFVLATNVWLVVRRRLPRTGFLAVFGFGILQMLLGVPIGLYDAALLFALYSVVGYTERRFGFFALAVALMGVVIGALTDWWVYVDQQLSEPSPLLRLLSAAGAAVLVLAAWGMGERLRSARRGWVALAQRADQLEREREQEALLAAAAERARIAREMHDVIAHGLSVMIVQADGAAYVVQDSPEAAQRALQQISTTGRQSLAEMRNLLGLLRSADSDAAGVVPQPDLNDLESLLSSVRAAGSIVELQVEGDPRTLPAMVALTAYRVVQEALTNARKHGGDRVAVEISYVDEGVRLVITDDGGRPSEALTQEAGYGLQGMAERVSAAGGTLAAGPAAAGFRVEAWLPAGTDGSRVGDGAEGSS